MTRFSAAIFAIALLTVLAAPAHAQDPQSSSDDTACAAEEISLASAESESGSSATGASAAGDAYAVPTASDTPAADVAPKTEAEADVQNVITQDGVHVVHFWAPWCPNAKNELEAGWSSLIANNPDVSFTFVSIWNDGEDGASVLDRYDIPTDRVTTLQQPDLGPSDTEANRRKAFLGIPMTWSPSTWVFHNNGELAFAMNYGEMPMDTLQSLIDATQKDW